MPEHTLFVDAETDGLYGTYLSAAALVTDDSGREIDRFSGAVKPEKTEIRSAWVRENVVPYLPLSEHFFDSEYDLQEAFWAFWMKHRETCVCVADVQSPVEARLFAACVGHDLPEREFLAPFPLLDLSTALYVKGLPPLADRPKMSGLPLVPHDPMNDVTMAAAIWHKLLQSETGGTE